MSSPSVRPRRWSGIDGLRALAVIAVVAFHFEPAAAPGGFLGVDVFFVLSGYLITRMITTEYLRAGRFGFWDFYRRRARRLLPGLAVVLVAVLAAAAFWRDQLATVRPASAAAAAYVSNWWLSYVHQSYFVSTGRPSMLQHLWSLAVEEQFYLLWPAVAIGVLALTARRFGTIPLAVLAAVLAAASTVEMALLAIAGNVPYDTDASRLYYGADTHSMGLLLGASVGAVAAGRGRPKPGTGRPRRRRLLWATDLLAAGAIIMLVVVVRTVGELSPALYRGGFLGVAALAALLTATVTRRGSLVGHALDRRALRWLADRSYAIYLWHWPVAVVTRPGVDLRWPSAWVLLLRVVVTIALADATYRVVEAPIRRRGLRASAREGGRRLRLVFEGRAPVGALIAVSALAALVLAAGGVLIAGPRPARTAAQRALAADHGGGRALPIGPPIRSPAITSSAAPTPSGPPASPPPSRSPRAGRPAARTAPTQRGQPSPRTSARATKTGTPAITHGLPSISAFGDSVMLGARTTLDSTFPGGTMDAVEGRQADPILHDVEQDAADHRLNPLVVIGVGDNGLIDPSMLRQTLSCLHGMHVIVVNNRVDREWQDPNNHTIASVVPHFPNARILDWHDDSRSHPTWFYDDGIHLTPQGAVAYTRLITDEARLL